MAKRKIRHDTDYVIVIGKKGYTVTQFYKLLEKGVVPKRIRIKQNGATLYEGSVLGALEVLEGLRLVKEEGLRWWW